jgi:cell division protein ZapA (FtsZ GTPase activity inhibitor)
MASIMVADELAEAEKELAARADSAAGGEERLSRAAESDLAGSLDGLAQRIEAIAARLERD